MGIGGGAGTDAGRAGRRRGRCLHGLRASWWEACAWTEAVLGANVVLTASTRIIDVTGPEPKEMKGHVPRAAW